jgi:hypothetical protein
MAVAAMLALALVAALVVAKVLNDDNGGDGRSATLSTRREARPTTTTISDDLWSRNGPAMQLFPQRAQAGAPLSLLLRGDGCAGGSGVVSISRVGAARDTQDLDRLIVRRRIDVAANGTWSTRPLLVGQPPGTYRVSASCERRAIADAIEPVSGRRDLFTATEVLELTAPAVVENFDVTPPFAEPGAALTVLVSGFQGCPPTTGGNPSTVSGSFIPNAGATGGIKPFAATVDAQGNWQTSVAFSAAEAQGSYSVAATCSVGFAFGERSLRFLDTSDIVVPPIFPWTGPVPPQQPNAPTPIPATPNYTG